LGVLWEHTYADRFSRSALSPLTGAGWLGVNLFFVLSGFVLMLPYARGEREMRSRADLMAFYARRARRLLPLYFIVVLVGFALFFVWNLRTLEWLAVTSSFLYVFHPRTYFPEPTGNLWSIGIEVWLSVAFPLLVVAWRRFGAGRALAFIAVLALATRVVGSHIHAADTVFPTFNVVKDSFVGRLDEFAAGAYVADRFVRAPSARHASALLALGLALFALGAWLWDAAASGTISLSASPFFNDVIDLGLALVLWSLLVGAPIARAVVASWPLQLAGMMCYSLYAWHGYAMPYLHDVFGVAGLLVVSALSYRFIEFGRQKDWRALFLLRPRERLGERA
jgi:peptidoglycan/LPS O-acetylase OafA/YrhL